MDKISKSQFLELVELAIACYGLEALYTEGSRRWDTEYLKTIDHAVAGYVYWTYDRSPDGGVIKAPYQYADNANLVINHWTYDDEQIQRPISLDV